MLLGGGGVLNMFRATGLLTAYVGGLQQSDEIFGQKILKTQLLFLFILFIWAEKTARLVRPRFFPIVWSFEARSRADQSWCGRESSEQSWKFCPDIPGVERGSLA